MVNIKHAITGCEEGSTVVLMLLLLKVILFLYIYAAKPSGFYLVVGLHPAHYLNVLIKGEKIRAKGTARIFFTTLDVACHM